MDRFVIGSTVYGVRVGTYVVTGYRTVAGERIMDVREVKPGGGLGAEMGMTEECFRYHPPFGLKSPYVNPYHAVVARMTIEERRARMAEITRMADAGEYNYEFGEYMALEDGIPEEAKARDEANKRNDRRIAAKRKRLG